MADRLDQKPPREPYNDPVFDRWFARLVIGFYLTALTVIAVKAGGGSNLW